MGLCKCPKRRVTNQFCFEHRVNVCEHCMVTNHPKCIVQSYLQWLQDSDYNPICELCMKDLKTEDCIRLACYHVYHWVCLDRLARELPTTTAPAGYTCPSCKTSLFPASNLVSPVADVLREKLAGVNWARAGLGLPLLAEDREQKPNENRFETPVAPQAAQSVSVPQHSVVMVDDNQITYSRGENSRRVFQHDMLNEAKQSLVDYDDDKYKRRPATEMVKRWWQNVSALQRNRGGGSLYKRYCMMALLVVSIFVVIAIIFSKLRHYSTDNDPLLDPINNPHIKVQHRVDSS